MLTIFLQNLLPAAFAQLADTRADPIVLLMRPLLTAFFGERFAVLTKLFLFRRRFTHFRLLGLSGWLGWFGFGFIEFHQVLVGDGMLSGMSVSIQIRHAREAHPTFLAMIKRHGFRSFFRVKGQVLIVGFFVVKRLAAFMQRAGVSFLRTLGSPFVFGLDVESETRLGVAGKTAGVAVEAPHFVVNGGHVVPQQSASPKLGGTNLAFDRMASKPDVRTDVDVVMHAVDVFVAYEALEGAVS